MEEEAKEGWMYDARAPVYRGIGVATSCEMFMKARLIYLHSRSADFIALVARPRLDTWTREKARQSIGTGRDSLIHLFFSVYF